MRKLDLFVLGAFRFRHVKVYNSSYKVVHNFDCDASILSMAVAVRLVNLHKEISKYELIMFFFFIYTLIEVLLVVVLL